MHDLTKWPLESGLADLSRRRKVPAHPAGEANNLGETPQKWELRIPCFEELFLGGNTLGLVPASLPHTLGWGRDWHLAMGRTPRHDLAFPPHITIVKMMSSF